MSYSLEEKVKHFAVCSRLGIIALQFLTNFLIPDHDAGAFRKPLDTNASSTPVDAVVESTFGGLTRWDAQYFLHIAHYGYTYENTLAFFPLFPLIIRQLGYFLLYAVNGIVGWFLPRSHLISIQSSLILASLIVNNVLFVQTSTVLYKLGLLVLKNEKLAYISAILFCVSPASIFFSAAYSESLYCFLVFYGLLKIEQKSSLANYVIIGMTAAVRSNGLINIGFLIYKYIKLKCSAKVPFFYSLIFNFGIVLSVLPFLSYQMYCYAKYCLPSNVVLPEFIYGHGNENNFVFPGSNPPWCKQLIPFAYTYVQKNYWNVGFLKYYEIKQIPNFLLATPMIYIIARGTFAFVKHYKLLILYLGLIGGDSGNALPVSVYPYVVHGFALTLFGICMIHVQVLTRLLASSSPLPYWFCAHVMASSVKSPVEGEVLHKLGKRDDGDYYHESYKNRKSRWRSFLFTETFGGYSFFIKWYFVIYFFVGTLMFSNHLPWT